MSLIQSIKRKINKALVRRNSISVPYYVSGSGAMYTNTSDIVRSTAFKKQISLVSQIRMSQEADCVQTATETICKDG